MTETILAEGIDPIAPAVDIDALKLGYVAPAPEVITPSAVIPAGEPLPAPAAYDRASLREFMREEFADVLEDISFRIQQAYDVAGRATGSVGQVFAEDLNLMSHQITGYTMTANSPVAGSIAWTDVHIVFNGVDYTVVNGNTANKYAWFVKPASGTSATLQTGNTKPVLGPNDCLVFFNNAGTPVNALTSSIPVAVVDGAIDSAALANGAVTAAKTDFYTALSNAVTAAQSDATAAMALADGSISTYFQASPPWANGDATAGGASNPSAKTGDMWYDSDDGNSYRWSGPTPGGAITPNNWILIEDSSIAAALGVANAAQTTANSKITTFYGPVASVPTALAAGDLWVVSDEGNRIRRATAAGGTLANWVAMQISGTAIANGGVTNTQLGSGIDGAKLSSGTVGSTQLGTNAVTPTKLNILQHIMF